MKPTLLCYNLSGEKASKIRFAAMRLRVLLRDVRPDEYGLTLNDLCGLETGGENVPCEETFPDEMLVMAGFTPMLMTSADVPADENPAGAAESHADRDQRSVGFLPSAPGNQRGA